MNTLESFLSYAYEDEEWRMHLEKHLSSLQRQQLIVTWQDLNVAPGEEKKSKISQHLRTAQIIVLLISTDFIASEQCWSIEMKNATERHTAGEACVIPVLVRPIDWKHAPFATLQVLPRNEQAISLWPHPDEALAQVTQEIRTVVEHLQQTSSTSFISLTENTGTAPKAITASMKIWNVPYERNPFFTGRENLLKDLHKILNKENMTALAQVQAISGLGGIGKTQTALEYIYHYCNEYSAIFWIKADSEVALRTDFIEIAKLLSLPERDTQNPDDTVNAVKRWLESKKNWLLIFDNADTPDILKAYYPHNSRSKGHILLTSRAQVFDILGIAKPIEMKEMLPEEALMFLFKRTGRDDKDLEERKAAEQLAYELGYLPLALEQSSAYILEKKARFQDYLTSYRKHHLAVLNKSLPKATNYPESVATTWAINFREIEKDPTAVDLLRLSAFLSPDNIPLEMIIAGASQLGPVLFNILATADTDPLVLNEILEPLTRYSLIRRDIDAHTYSIHRLVQEVVKDAMDTDTRIIWAERAVKAIYLAFQDVEPTSQSRRQRCLQHAQACTELIDQLEMTFAEAAQLLHHTGLFLQERVQYKEAEPLLTKSLAIREKALEAEHLDIAENLHDLAWLYHDMGKFSQAEPLLIKALAIKEKSLGTEHPDVAISLNILAEVLIHLEKYSQAESLLIHAKTICERSLNPESAILHNLARLYSKQGKNELAESLFQQAIAIEEEHSGANSPGLASDFHNLALHYSDQNEYKLAESLFQQALAIYEKNEMSDHPYRAITLDHLARLYSKQSKHELAEPLFQQALAIYEKTMEPHHFWVYLCRLNQAGHYENQGKYPQAKSLYEQVLATLEKDLGSEHPDVAYTLSEFAWFYHDQRKYEQAEILLRKALTIQEKTFKSDHPEMYTTLFKLGDIYIHQQKYVKAEPLLIQALAMQEKVPMRVQIKKEDILKKLIALYQYQGRYDKAEPLFRQLLTSYKNTLAVCRREQKYGAEC